MSLFNRIAIGTANWGKKYRGVQVPQKDKERILEVAYEWGINTVDTAVAYENDVYELAYDKWFKIIDKIPDRWHIVKQIRPYAILAHCSPSRHMIEWLEKIKKEGECDKIGWSIYSNDAKPDLDIIQIPYNPYDRLAIEYVNQLDKGNMELHVRSIFCAGKALKEFGVKSCMMFALMNPKIDKVVMGFDSFDQFRDDLEWIVTLENSWSNNPDVYDTRRF